MISKPLIYLPLKLKKAVRTCIQIASCRRELTLGGILRSSGVVMILVLLLSFGIGQTVPVNSRGGEPPARNATHSVAGGSASRPTLLAGSPLPPRITAKAAYLLDLKSGFVLYDKNSLLKLPPASTVKIATALAALDDYELDEVVTVHRNCILRTGESIMGLHAREKISVRNLLRGLLISSAGDAACALALHHQEGMMEFVAEMNHLATTLKLERTYFVNPAGLDSNFQHSTAKELAFLAKEALKSSFFRKVVRTKELTIASVGRNRWYRLKTTNELLGKMPGVLGVKTGYTARAKEVFVFYFKNGGKELLGTVLGSNHRFDDTRALLNWVLSSFRFP